MEVKKKVKNYEVLFIITYNSPSDQILKLVLMN